MEVSVCCLCQTGSIVQKNHRPVWAQIPKRQTFVRNHLRVFNCTSLFFHLKCIWSSCQAHVFIKLLKRLWRVIMSDLATCDLYWKIYILKRSGEWLLEVVGCCWMKLVARSPVVCMEVTYLFSNTCNLLSERHLNYENCDIHRQQRMFAFKVKTVPYCYNQHASDKIK